MRTRILLVISSAVLFATVSASIVAYAQTRPCFGADGKVYDGRMIQLKGQVSFLNHPEVGKMRANGMYLVFQREGCKKCIVGTHADFDGKYELFVGEGRYKLIVQDNRCDYGGTGCDCHDLLAPKQPRYVNAKRSPHATEFDIDLVLRKD